jgi:hypothetical protein
VRFRAASLTVQTLDLEIPENKGIAIAINDNVIPKSTVYP